ncbi:CDP-alcohol phosphatidyltransferase family protein [Alkalicoccobacillus porphyridii]|uniref:CDP-alcohol phosphatidyltransferase family protein n=1 Tax=Alkalicoccobacillus porphyridii TaxID=2597270 RepID=A0A554A3W1_9BACI|nr:CDP-alcohol phosphatidyltransferase family protein [Alkalicoccobacillus porphyridii]TSB48381.1 CDP-alcohol phosphatidyltransferase family protein [Alkalicoccobacillus porphyridii]
MASEKLSTFFFDSKQIIELRRKVQPYSAKEDLWSWYVLRRMSIYFTLLFNKMNFTPNMVSWLSLFFVLLSGLLVMFATPLGFLFAFISYNIGYLFDCVDGELARLTKRTSKLGFFIDMLIRAATLPVFLSFVVTFLLMTDALVLSNLAIIILYLVMVSVIMSLLLPLSFDLTHQQANEQQDPVQKIRNKSIVYEFAGFILGLPGFFLTLVILTLLELLITIEITPFYLLLFVFILVLKVILRFIVTVKTFK